MILQGCLCYYSLHKWGLDPSNFEMFGFAIYVHFYHVFLNISNLLEVVLLHKHCPNHFCIFGVKMSIVVLIDKSCKLCSKTVFNPNFYSHKFKKMFSIYSNGNESHVPISYYIALFDSWLLTLTFTWLFHEIFFVVAYEHVFMSLVCLIDIWSILWHKVYV